MEFMPYVVENTGKGERSGDIYSRLQEDGIILLYGPISDDVAQRVVAQMLYLDAKYPNRDINLYINSPGGEIDAGMAIYDTMQYIKPQVATICMGLAASLGAFLLMAGAKGKRFALPNARVMIHQPLGGAGGQATDVEIHAQELIRMRKLLNGIMAKHAGQSLDKVNADTERDNFLTSQQALEYGIIDKVWERQSA